MGWDEILEGGISAECGSDELARNAEGGIQAAKEGGMTLE